MKNLFIASVLVIASAGSAFAGTTSNTITNTYSTGHRNVDVKNVRVETGAFENYNSNLKIDSVVDEGGFAQSNMSFDGSKFTGGGSAVLGATGNDPWTNGGFVENIETGTYTDITEVTQIESVDFTSDSIEYRLDAN